MTQAPFTPPAVPPHAVQQAGFAYHRMHVGGRRGIWRPLLGVLVVALTMFFGGALVLMITALVHAAALALQGRDVAAAESTLTFDTLTPWGLAGLALSLAVLIPVCVGLQRLLHQLPAFSLTSVVGRMRWRYFWACWGAALIALMATLVVSALVPVDVAGDSSGELATLSATTVAYFVVIVALIPFQAAGEEYAFRGYLTQAFGGALAKAPEAVVSTIAVLGPALVFALAHGAQDPPIFFDRFAFGVVAGILVLRTGGLEAAIAMHVLNNWFAFSLAVIFSQTDDVLTPSGGSWWSIPVTLTQSLLYLWLALRLAKAMGVQRRSDVQGGGPVLALGSRPV